MDGIDFLFCDFRENIIAKALENEPAAGTLFIFPTESSKALAMRQFQSKWEFTSTQFLTIEELKKLAFLTEKPLLKEEKRTLAFFASLSDEDREHFRARNYFQSIELAGHFFELWEEFNEEMVPPQRPLERFSVDENFLPWQKETYQHLLKIREQYRQSIEAKNFSDIIFIYNPQHLDLSFFEEFQRVIFVNQFYYTALEKFLLRKFSAAGKIVRLYYQLPENAVDKSDLSVRHFEVDEIDNVRTSRIHLFEAPNHFSMLLKFFEIARNTGVNHVVDVGFHDRPYARFLSEQKFRLLSQIRFTETTIYRLLQTLSEIVDSLIFDAERRDFLLPVQSILSAALNEETVHFVMRDSEVKVSRDEVLSEIYDLIDNDFRYVDFQGRFFHVREQKNARNFIAPLTRILEHLLKIKNIDGLVRWINHPQYGVNPEKICSDFELRYTDIGEIFFQSLGDFVSIEQVFWQGDWTKFFSDARRKKELAIAGGLLRLLVDYLKAKRISFTPQTGENLISVSNLEDTRNVSYSQVAVWNASEEVIPSPRKTPFLFTENQRRRLGLKTYEEIRERERYYFLRLIFNSQQVYLFSLKNIDQNIDVSSFVEELKTHRPELCSQTIEIKDKFYREIYSQLLNKTAEPVQSKISTKAFFSLPVIKERDFPNAKLELNYYNFADLLYNLFAFFLKVIAGIEEPPRAVKEDFSGKFLGNFAHDVLNRLWRKIIDEQGALSPGFDFSVVSKKMAEETIRETRKSESNYYKFPQNYVRIYFDEILSDIFARHIHQFFQEMKRLFNGKNIHAFPEKDFGTPEERKAKTFIERGADNIDVEVGIKGRCDLRIEDHSSQPVQFHIFDYKTGKRQDREQLIFYELFYYLLDEKAEFSDVHSYFFSIMDGELKSLKDLLGRKSKQDRIEAIKDAIIEAIQIIESEGFSLPQQKSRLGKMEAITRGDLFLKERAKVNDSTRMDAD